jgi:DDE superfamily endonuclease
VAQRHPAWALGFADEVWWSREAQPTLSAWAPKDRCLHLVEQTVAKDDPDPKALACYGLLVRTRGHGNEPAEEVWLRFVDGRPVSVVTIPFLDWCCTKLAAAGKVALLLVWDNASWHKSAAVRAWIRSHHCQVKATQRGVRIVPCPLPTKSPWLNPIEPRWVQTKRKVVDPDRLLSAAELVDRVCAALGCPHEDHLHIPEKVA